MRETKPRWEEEHPWMERMEIHTTDNLAIGDKASTKLDRPPHHSPWECMMKVVNRLMRRWKLLYARLQRATEKLRKVNNGSDC